MNHQPHHHHDDDLIDVNAPATAETIIHALSQFHTEHEQGGGYDHDQNLFNLQDRLTSGTGNATGTGTDDLEGDDETLGGMSRRELEDEVIRLRGLVQAPPDGGNGNGDEGTHDTRLLPGPSRKRLKKSASTVDVAPPLREIQPGTGKRVERDRKTELYKAIRHRVSYTPWLKLA